MKDKDKTKEKIDELFDIKLNGSWDAFKEELEAINKEIDVLSLDDIRRIKKTIYNKLERLDE